MENFTYTCDARLRDAKVLPNEAVSLSIGTQTQQLDIVTARVAVKECKKAVNDFLHIQPVSPTKSDCGFYAEYVMG